RSTELAEHRLRSRQRRNYETLCQWLPDMLPMFVGPEWWATIVGLFEAIPVLFSDNSESRLMETTMGKLRQLQKFAENLSNQSADDKNNWDTIRNNYLPKQQQTIGYLSDTLCPLMSNTNRANEIKTF